MGTVIAGTTALLLGALACLPSEDLAGYSSGNRRIEPGITLEDSASGQGSLPGISTTGVEPSPAEDRLPGAPLASSECNEDCSVTELPRLIDAGAGDLAGESGGSVAAGDVPASQGDAGVLPVPGAVEPAGPCGQGALLADERCFALLGPPSTWSDARAACVARGTGWDLAVIRGAERNSGLASMLDGGSDAWLGANDLTQEGSWRWLGDASPFFTGTGTAGSAAAGAYVNWTTGGTPEPNGGAMSDCLRLRVSGGWADTACTSTFAALCEGPPP